MLILKVFIPDLTISEFNHFINTIFFNVYIIFIFTHLIAFKYKKNAFWHKLCFKPFINQVIEKYYPQLNFNVMKTKFILPALLAFSMSAAPALTYGQGTSNQGTTNQGTSTQGTTTQGTSTQGTTRSTQNMQNQRGDDKENKVRIEANSLPMPIRQKIASDSEFGNRSIQEAWMIHKEDGEVYYRVKFDGDGEEDKNTKVYDANGNEKKDKKKDDNK
jgi:hypothetical protein